MAEAVQPDFVVDDGNLLEGRQRPFGEAAEEAVAALETVLGVGDDDPAIGVFSGR